MDKENKHIIPRDQYRRQRRVFDSEQNQNSDNRSHDIEYGETGPDDGYGYKETERNEALQEASGDAGFSGSNKQSDSSYGYKDNEPETDEEVSAVGGYGATEAAASDNKNSGNEEPVNRSSRKKGGSNGPVRGFIIPLIAGMIGALIILLAFNYFNDGDSGSTDVASENTSTEQDIEDTRADLEESTDDDRPVSDTTAAIQTARESVVSVINMQRAESFMPGMSQDQTAEPEEAGVGSGVIYKVTDDSAYIVTNHHVVDGAEELQVNMENGDSITGELIGSDIWTDLAVIRVDRGSIENTIPFGDSDDLLVGEEAIAIGSPLGEAFSGSVSQGIVSGLDRSVPVDLDGDGSYDWEANVIQTDAAINPGNSGGALINASGELIGINSMKISMPTVEGIGFAIPANEVEKITAQIEENGGVTRPFLGVSLQDLYTIPRDVVVNQMNVPEDVSAGVVVSNIQNPSPAVDAGLEQLDLIVALDGNEVGSMMELRQYLYYEKQPGDEMDVTFYRQGEEQTVTVVLE